MSDSVKRTADERHRLAVEYPVAMTPRAAEEIVKHTTVERTRVLHANHHPGEHLLQHARRGDEKSRADLAHVLEDRVAAFRTGNTEAGDQRLHVVEIMVTRPRRRQIGERLVA